MGPEPEKGEVAVGRIVIRPAILKLAAAMEEKLRQNEHKGGWNACDHEYLLNRLLDEYQELVKAVAEYDAEAILEEAADVANFCVMIVDNVFGDMRKSHNDATIPEKGETAGCYRCCHQTVHPKAFPIGEQEDGYPGGDLQYYKCPDCGVVWLEEIAQ